MPINFTIGSVPSAADGPTQSLQKLNSLLLSSFDVVQAAALISVATSGSGSTYVAFESVACKQLTILNHSGTSLEVLRDGAGVALDLPDIAYWSFRGLTNANQISLRRADHSGTTVTIKAEVEV